MTATDTRVPPIPAGTLCRFGARVVRAYATIQVGRLWDGTYRIHERDGGWVPGTVTREQLEVIR